jgi:hypothetical protein
MVTCSKPQFTPHDVPHAYGSAKILSQAVQHLSPVIGIVKDDKILLGRYL